MRKKKRWKSKKILDFTKEVLYDTGDPEHIKHITCQLCDEEFEDCDEIWLLTLCPHIFHSECLISYIKLTLDGTPSCPVCDVKISLD